jgi:hypothetical protein
MGTLRRLEDTPSCANDFQYPLIEILSFRELAVLRLAGIEVPVKQHDVTCWQ